MGSELGGGQKWGRELGLGYVVRGILSWVHLGLGGHLVLGNLVLRDLVLRDLLLIHCSNTRVTSIHDLLALFFYRISMNSQIYR